MALISSLQNSKKRLFHIPENNNKETLITVGKTDIFFPIPEVSQFLQSEFAIVKVIISFSLISANILFSIMLLSLTSIKIKPFQKTPHI